MHFGLVAPLRWFESRRGGRVRAFGFAAGLAWAGIVPACADVPEDGEEEPAAGSILLTDANNYQSTTMLSIPVIETMPGVSLDVCWGDVVKDLQCHAVDPAMDVDNVALLRFPNATQEDVEGMLGATGLDTNDLASYHDVAVPEGINPMAPCVQTGNMDSFEDPIVLAEDYVAGTMDTYMLVLTRGTTPGLGAITMMFVQPVAGNANTMVTVPPGCSSDETMRLLDFTATLSPTRVSIPAAGPSWVVDWSQVTKEGVADIDRVLIGFYANKAVEDLQANILDLEYDDPVMDYYTNVWEAPIGREKNIDLALAVERGTNAPFPGFTETGGVYVLGLMCGICQNPAPIVLTVLQPV